MDVDAIDLVEKRIEALERQILPKGPQPSNVKFQPITDLLTQTQTMISSALSCREAITTTLQQLDTINSYLDPNNGENDLEVEAKRQYLLELYPELQETVQLIGKFQSLLPHTNSETVLKVTQLSDKLERLWMTNQSVYEDSKEVTRNVLKSLQQYNDITNSIVVLFAQLDVAITNLETGLQPQFETEE